MRLDPSELDALADDLASRLVPRIVAQLREHLRTNESCEDGRLVGCDELSEKIGLSANTIRARVADGIIPSIRVGRRRLFDVSAVMDALGNQ